MGVKRYSDAQIMWLTTQGYSRIWKNRKEFREAFNKTFGLNVDVYKFNNLIDYYKIKICTRQTESLFTEEQKQWLIKNAKSGKFKNCRQLTNTYNTIFKECRKSENINGYLSHWGVLLNTVYKNSCYTEDMNNWLRDNYLTFETVNEAVIKFNEIFNVTKTNASLSHHCRNLGIKRCSTRFKKNCRPPQSKDLYSISYHNDYPWIKVDMSNKKSSWIPLHKYVWEQAHGKIPDGYCVVFLSKNHTDVSLDNLALINRRATPIMGKFGWWVDNQVITKAGVQWCNLYCVAKDNNIEEEL